MASLQRRVLLLFTLIYACCPTVSGDHGGNWTIYYDMDDEPVPLLRSELRENTLRYGILPCSCLDYTCGCCMNVDVNFANFTRNGCMNFTYIPLEFAIEMNVLMNEESIYKRNVSGKNPPPACMEIPINYLPTMQFCIKFFDLYTIGRNMHMCIDFETRIERAPILVLQFDCFVMGTEGLSHQKPTESSAMVSEGGEDNKKNITGIQTEYSAVIPTRIISSYLKETKNSSGGTANEFLPSDTPTQAVDIISSKPGLLSLSMDCCKNGTDNDNSYSEQNPENITNSTSIVNT